MLQWSLEYIYLLELVFFLFLSKYAEVQWLNNVKILFLDFWGPSILFSIVAAPIYAPANNGWAFLCFHILINTLFVVFLIPFYRVSLYLIMEKTHFFFLMDKMHSWKLPLFLIPFCSHPTTNWTVGPIVVDYFCSTGNTMIAFLYF